MTSYTLGQKVIAPTKPDRGVFPLDHKGRWRKEEKNNKKKRQSNMILLFSR